MNWQRERERASKWTLLFFFCFFCHESSSIRRWQSLTWSNHFFLSAKKKSVVVRFNWYISGLCPEPRSFREGRGVQIETYWARFKRIISSCGRLGHTKFGPVTGIPERHAYFKTTKQDRDRGPRGGWGENLERSYYQMNSCHCWARLEPILRYSHLGSEKKKKRKKSPLVQIVSMTVSILPFECEIFGLNLLVNKYM